MDLSIAHEVVYTYKQKGLDPLKTQRDAFLADLQQLLRKYNIWTHYFFGIDAQGPFADYVISQDELTDMVFDILEHDGFAEAAEQIVRTIAEELMRSDDEPIDIAKLDEMKWTWRKKD